MGSVFVPGGFHHILWDVSQAPALREYLPRRQQGLPLYEEYPQIVLYPGLSTCLPQSPHSLLATLGRGQ